jgi:hypothetical protein
MSDAPATPPTEYLDTAARENLVRRLEYAKGLQAKVRTRTGRIKNAKFKAAVLALRFERFSPKESADILGVTIGQVTGALRTLKAAAELDDHIKTIDHEILPMAVENLARAVLDGDVDVSEKIARGRGLLRTFKQQEVSITKREMKLTINVEMKGRDGQAVPIAVRDGSIVGHAAGPDEFDASAGQKSGLLEAPK